MTRRLVFRLPLLLVIGIGMAAVVPTLAQTPEQASPVEQSPAAEQVQTALAIVYKPGLRGAPGGRVGGASRSAAAPSMPLPIIELLAPADHAGMTASPEPTLYFFISRPVQWPMQFTISAPMRPVPIIEVTIPSPTAAGIYALPATAYNFRLQPGIVYTWSVSIILEPRAWSRNIVASATIMSDPTLAPAFPTSTPLQRAIHFAQAGLWYDAVAEAGAREPGRRMALDALMRQVGLTVAVAHDRGKETQ